MIANELHEDQEYICNIVFDRLKKISINACER